MRLITPPLCVTAFWLRIPMWGYEALSAASYAAARLVTNPHVGL